MSMRSLFFAALPLALLLGCPPPNGNPPPGDSGPQAPRTCLVDDVETVRPAEPARRKDLGVPVLTCVDDPPELAPSRDVTVEGCVDIFGIGSKAKPTLRVAFYDVTQNPKDDAPAYGFTEIAVKAQAGPLQARAAECSTEGFYRIDNIPTNKRLIVKVYDTDTGVAQTAIPTYTYYVLLPDERVVEGVLNYEANLVYKTTYDSIPTLGGKRIDGQQIVYDGVGRGVIAGEIRDCDGRTLMNAAVSSSKFDNNTKMAYFNGDEDPKPDLTRNTTNNDGLYVVLNASTDSGNDLHRIAVGILDEECEEASDEPCPCRSLGSAEVRAFPDSVTIVSFEGDLSVGL